MVGASIFETVGTLNLISPPVTEEKDCNLVPAGNCTFASKAAIGFLVARHSTPLATASLVEPGLLVPKKLSLVNQPVSP